MFESFRDRFVPDRYVGSPRLVWDAPALMMTSGYRELADEFAGRSFRAGLYRIHDAYSGPKAQALVSFGFPKYEKQVFPFGCDWLGRQFCVDGRRAASEAPVLLFEPGTGEVLEIPASFATFHNDELVHFEDAALASSFFLDWSQGHLPDLPISADECVGYRIPLFLGGKDTVDNLELIDLEAYWSICAQLLRGAKTLPRGAFIQQIFTEGGR